MIVFSASACHRSASFNSSLSGRGAIGQIIARPRAQHQINWIAQPCCGPVEQSGKGAVGHKASQIRVHKVGRIKDRVRRFHQLRYRRLPPDIRQIWQRASRPFCPDRSPKCESGSLPLCAAGTIASSFFEVSARFIQRMFDPKGRDFDRAVVRTATPPASPRRSIRVRQLGCQRP
jgi:hypothetical protein